MVSRYFMPVGGTGGGPTERPFRPELWHYIFTQTQLKDSERKVALLTTPSQLSNNKINTDNLIGNYKSLEEKLGCTFQPIDEMLFGRGEYNGKFNILCITCGNTAAARKCWQAIGCEETIQQWYNGGVICTGYSAGFIVFYDWASTDSVLGPPTTEFGIMSGMSIIKGGAIPHADTQPRRIPDFQLTLKERTIEPVLALGENVMAVYVNETLRHLVSPVPKPLACLVNQDSIEKLDVEKLDRSPK